MDKNKINLLNLFSLTFIITGAITFLFAMVYFDNIILLLSLIQLMSGSVGLYLIQTNPKNSPMIYKGKRH